MPIIDAPFRILRGIRAALSGCVVSCWSYLAIPPHKQRYIVVLPLRTNCVRLTLVSFPQPPLCFLTLSAILVTPPIVLVLLSRKEFLLPLSRLYDFWLVMFPFLPRDAQFICDSACRFSSSLKPTQTLLTSPNSPRLSTTLLPSRVPRSLNAVSRLTDRSCPPRHPKGLGSPTLLLFPHRSFRPP